MMWTKIKAFVVQVGSNPVYLLVLLLAGVYIVVSQVLGKKQPIDSKVEKELGKSLKEITDEEEKADSAGVNSVIDYEELKRRYLESQKPGSDS